MMGHPLPSGSRLHSNSIICRFRKVSSKLNSGLGIGSPSVSDERPFLVPTSLFLTAAKMTQQLLGGGGGAVAPEWIDQERVGEDGRHRITREGIERAEIPAVRPREIADEF